LLTKIFNFKNFLIPRYIVGAMAPYILITLLLLTASCWHNKPRVSLKIVIYADLPSHSRIDRRRVVAGRSHLLDSTRNTCRNNHWLLADGSDSEIVAMRAAGVGSWTMIWPRTLVGLLFTGATTYLHLKEVPEAARDLERIALEGMLAKLDSPVEPRTFSTLPRYVIYVRDGNKEQGTWGRVFIFGQDADHTTRSTPLVPDVSTQPAISLSWFSVMCFRRSFPVAAAEEN
jgi:hypothetical protein